MTQQPHPASCGSVSQHFEEFKVGDELATEKLWNRYFERLIRLARQKMGTLPRQVVGSEDVALDVFACLCRGVVNGRFPKLNNRADLWKILLKINHDTVVDVIRRQNAKKQPPIAATPEEFWQQVADRQPTPDELVTLGDQFEALLDLLEDGHERWVAQLRMEGRSAKEIAKLVGVAPRSVERKLRIIRTVWQNSLSGDP